MRRGVIEREAVRAVASRFSAEWDGSVSASGARVKLAGTAVTLAVLAGGQFMRRRETGEPRLRFDRGVLRLAAGLRDALAQSVPAGTTVVVTVTAPIRLRGRTEDALVEIIRRVLARRSPPSRVAATVHGNRVQVRTLKGRTGSSHPLITFVHNPQPDPSVLFDSVRALLACLGSGARTASGLKRERWLVVADPAGRAPIRTIRQVAEQLCPPGTFSRMLAVGAGGTVTPFDR